MSHSRTQLAAQLRREVDHTLAATRNGAALNLHYENGRAVWRLTPGPFVTPTAAKIVIASNEVVDVGDSLFPGHPGQTWRHCDVCARELVDGANGRDEAAR